MVRAQHLAEGVVLVEIHWVLGHLDVKVNEKVDDIVTLAPETRGTPRCPKWFTFLSHIERTVSEQERKEAKHRF